MSLRIAPPTPNLFLNQGDLPSWWGERGNELWATENAVCPQIIEHPGRDAPSNARIIVRCDDCGLGRFILWNDDPQVDIGDHVRFASGTISCEGGATVIIGEGLGTGPLAGLDARNGGSIVVGPAGLWSTQVQIMTDDMHAVVDLVSDERVNRRGSHIAIGRHVWIGQETMILAGASIGDDSVLGARSTLAGAISSNVLAVGSPARVIREGVTWTREDRA